VPATEAQLNAPTDVEVSADGTVYVADTGNSCVRAIRTDGVIETVAGICAAPGFSGDRGRATQATLNRPYGIELDGEGNLLIADTDNHRVRRVQLRAR
jgi:DNA-binding beta-propeller fold protein YncE